MKLKTKLIAIACISLCVSTIIGCDASINNNLTNNITPERTITPDINESNNSLDFNESSLTENEIDGLFKTPKEQLINHYGEDYTLIDDSNTNVLKYKSGIIMDFEDLNNDYCSDELYCLYIDNGIFNNARSGMNFDEIKRALGESNITKQYIPGRKEGVYLLSYKYKYFSALFESNDITGDNSKLSFWANHNSHIQNQNDLPEDKSFPKDELITNKININDMINFGFMNKLDIINIYGPDYKCINIGPDSYYDGIYYDDLGLTFVFEESDLLNTLGTEKYIDNESILYWIRIENDSMNIADIEPHMDFKQIQSIMGDGKIRENSTILEDESSHKEYSLVYNMYNFDLCFIADNKNGQDWRCDVMYATLK